jgi:membrane protease YdiL (CAAX protease family)
MISVDPADGPAFQAKAWNGWIALSAFLGTFFIVEILGNVAALSIIVSMHPELRAHWSTAKYVESPPDAVILTAAWLIAAFAALILLRLVLGITPASIGLTVPKAAQVLFGLVSGIGLLVISGIVLGAQSRLIGHHAIKTAAYFHGHHGLVAYAADVLEAVVAAPFLEELLFRGLLFTALVQRMPIWLAALLSACLFSAFHLDPYAFLFRVAVGVGLAYIYYNTRNLWVSVAAHATINLIAVSAVYHSGAPPPH